MIGITILGSTVSIGASTLDAISRHPDRYRAVALTANRDVEGLIRQCRVFRPDYAAMADSRSALDLKQRVQAENLPVKVLSGVERL